MRIIEKVIKEITFFNMEKKGKWTKIIRRSEYVFINYVLYIEKYYLVDVRYQQIEGYLIKELDIIYLIFNVMENQEDSKKLLIIGIHL